MTTAADAPPKGSGFKLMNAFVDFDMSGLPRNEALVWLVLFRDTDRETNTARASCGRIAARVGCSVRHVKRVVKRLVERGLLRVERQGGLSRGPSVYRVLAGPG